jgi:hypothetical protein
VTVTTRHTPLPRPYDHVLTPDDLARYGAVLPARQAAALRLRLAGFAYAHIGARLGMSTPSAYYMVLRACEHLSYTKRQGLRTEDRGA